MNGRRAALPSKRRAAGTVIGPGPASRRPLNVLQPTAGTKRHGPTLPYNPGSRLGTNTGRPTVTSPGVSITLMLRGNSSRAWSWCAGGKPLQERPAQRGLACTL